MASDSGKEKNIFGRPRRSSFVPATAENDDFVPILPAVGSTPLPAAADVNYFPTVETGQPSLREPEPPARLVVPIRRSMTEEEIATAFAESQDMSSSEQIALLDSQMTLREDDLRTARSFLATLRTANPREAEPLLDELKARFMDVDPEVAEFSLSEPTESRAETAVTDTVGAVEASATVQAVPETAVNSGDSSPSMAPSAQAGNAADESPLGRYRGWGAVIALATVIAAIVPLSAAVFTVYGAPAPELVESLLGVPGVIMLVVAIASTVPLVLLARSTAARNGLTLRAALSRVVGSASGIILSIVLAVFVLIGFVGVLVSTTQGVGLQLASIPGLASFVTTTTPKAHLTVLVVTALVALGFALAALPRRLFRATILLLTGFLVAGPSVVLLTNIAVVGNVTSGSSVTAESLLLATGIIPIAVILLAWVETGAATVVRRDDRHLHGLWLYLGIFVGIAFSAWVLLAGMGNDSAGSVFVGSNPVLHLVAPSTELAFVFGVIVFAVPILFLAALLGRTISMLTVRNDADMPRVWIRLLVVAIPLALFVLDALGVLPDLATVIPAAPFLSIPVMAVVGLMAGASVASRRGLTGGANVVNTVLTSLLSIAGLALTLWAVPGLEPIYSASIAPLASSIGLSGSTAFVVPSVILLLAFVCSLVVSAFGARPPTNAG